MFMCSESPFSWSLCSKGQAVSKYNDTEVVRVVGKSIADKDSWQVECASDKK
jgi:hypothetical protein